jgi:hypothetical protein
LGTKHRRIGEALRIPDPGGICTLIGTSTNLLVDDMASVAGQSHFGIVYRLGNYSYMDYVRLGIPLNLLT